MTRFYKLYHLLNVFGVMPSFVLPIFSDGDAFYFQEIEHDRISSFSKADLTCFSECKMIDVNTPMEYTIGSSAIYAIQCPDSTCFMGHSREILSFFDNYSSMLNQYPVFFDNMQEFKRCLQRGVIDDTPTDTHDTRNEQKEQTSSTAPILQPKCVLPADSDRQKHLMIQYNQNSVIKYYNKPVPIRTKGRDSEDEISKHIFENQHKAVYFLPSSVITANNIFHFRELINAERRDADPIVLEIARNSFLPVSSQIGVINILLNYTPLSYAKIMNRRDRIVRDHNRKALMVFSYDGSRFPRWRSNLWTYSHVYRLFKLPGTGRVLYAGNMLQSVIKGWGLYIDVPISSIFKDIPDRFSWLSDYFGIEDSDIITGASKVFWLEIRKLSKRVNAIIAQDFFTDEPCFWIKEKPVSSSLLTSFIDGLYQDAKRKVSLLLLYVNCDDNPIDDCFSEWLNNNDKKCQILEIPQQLYAR